MTPEPDAPDDTDLDAFAEGRLQGPRRHAVAAWLSRRPDAAAEAMGRIALREGLRLALDATQPPAPPAMQAAAADLTRRLRRRGPLRLARGAAAAAALVAVGWLGHAATGRLAAASLPGAVEAALDAETALALRQRLASATPGTPVDPARISETAGIPLPRFPDGWTVVDAQILPSPDAPALAVRIDTPDQGRVLLFSVPTAGEARDGATRALNHEGRAVAYFETSDITHVLVDPTGAPEALARSATDLASRLR
jgi:anti-sigma factor RsiW